MPEYRKDPIKIIEHSRGKGQAKYKDGEWWFRYIIECISGECGEWQKDLAPLTEEWFAIKRKMRDEE